MGNAFVHQYYLILHQSPEHVHRFYQDISKLGRPEENGVMSITTTMQVSDFLPVLCFLTSYMSFIFVLYFFAASLLETYKFDSGREWIEDQFVNDTEKKSLIWHGSLLFLANCLYEKQ